MPPILYFFALCNLVIGSGAFVLGGILQPMSVSLGISVAAAGQAMTAYAIATAVLAPVLIIVTAKWPRKRAVQLALSLFALGCLVCALAPNFTLLLLGRVLMGAGAMFTAAASALAVSMVAPAQRGRALSITFLGMSISYAVGLPIGAWLGFEFGWRVPVWLSAAASVAALVAASWLIPANMASAGTSFAGFRSAARQPAVLRVWGRTLLYFIAIFSVFAYVGPVLHALNPMTSTQLSITLAVFGLAGVAGTLVGGWATDRFGALRSMRVQLAVLITMMCLLPLTGGNVPATLAVLVAWGIAGFGLMAPQQSRLAMLSPAQAPLLLSLNGSMLYVGTALGAVISGSLLGEVGFARLGWVGVPFGLMAMLTLVFEREPARVPASAAA
ncbi:MULTISPECIES: MFS transporter [unclassified Polaromonas]|uniref:MFS transporter n=1 Tax=unclassified Polaromonas TaxID=2638319 RepID=UPI000F08DB8E|nr:MULTISPECIES: MFS transporter [unclassified Polaromonas]AYQ28842.1 MFS transporter [Polaromonas sp. SP1]QGJ20042.1 MFS transporter [Polaromonas sp. Pch-P]